MEEVLGEALGVQLLSNGKVVRPQQCVFPDIPADPNSDVPSKDVLIDTTTGVWSRLYLPKVSREKTKALPVVFYYHGGGFITFSPKSSFYDHMCKTVCQRLEVMVISVSYRLAPEHRLPTAFEDALSALVWAKEQSEKEVPDEPWLAYADLTKTFLMGNSAGSTIAHQILKKLTTTHDHDLSPINIRGVVPVVPFFGGVERTESELRSLREPDTLKLHECDTFWYFSLPEASDRDHPYARVPKAEELVGIKVPPCLIVIGEKDPLNCRQIEYYEELKKAGKDVELIEYKDQGHLLVFPEAEDVKVLEKFINKCISA